VQIITETNRQIPAWHSGASRDFSVHEAHIVLERISHLVINTLISGNENTNISQFRDKSAKNISHFRDKKAKNISHFRFAGSADAVEQAALPVRLPAPAVYRSQKADGQIERTIRRRSRSGRKLLWAVLLRMPQKDAARGTG
jgi:hypothetical protein